MDLFPIILDPDARRFAIAARTPKLTPRLREIGGLVAAGLSYAEIANRLGIQPGTVKIRLSKEIYPACGVHSRWGFMRYWIQNVEERGDCRTCLLRMAHDEGRAG
jgi:DNA-binding NarL/FixJ family response regulator